MKTSVQEANRLMGNAPLVKSRYDTLLTRSSWKKLEQQHQSSLNRVAHRHEARCASREVN